MKINSITNIPAYNSSKQKAFNNIKADNSTAFQGLKETKYKSAIPMGSGIIRSIINRKAPSTRTGTIGAAKQGSAGDCYLLSSINALSYTKKGAEIIKNSLEYDKDGTTVHLKGAGDYYISNKELNRAKGSRLYAKGDDDLLILELATQKVRDDILSDRFILPQDVPKEMGYSSLEKSSHLFKPSIKAGNEIEPMYYITGKVGTVVKTPEQITSVLNKFIQNKGQDYALCTSFKPIKSIDGTDMWRIYDSEGKIATLYSEHSYAVKSADENTVTIVNPHDSSKNITLTKDSFLLHFDELYGLDLSENNPDKQFLIPAKKEIIRGKNGGFTQLTKRPDGTIYRREEGNSKGNLLSKEIYDEKNCLKQLYLYRPSGKLNSYFSYNYYASGEKEYVFEEYYNKKGQTSLQLETYFRPDGTIAYSSNTEFKNGTKTDTQYKIHDENKN